MSSSAPDQEPKPQPKWSGGPPKPPKKTARGLFDGSEEHKHEGDLTQKAISVVTYVHGTLNELFNVSRGSRPRILESLETDLDHEIVLLSGFARQVQGEDRESVTGCLRLIRDYRRLHSRGVASNRELAEQAQKILDDVK